MTGRDLCSALFRVMGLFWVVSSALSIPGLLVARAGTAGFDPEFGDVESIYTFQLVAALLLLGIGTTLLLGTEGLLRRLYGPAPGPPGPPLTAAALQTFAFSVLGVWVVAEALPRIGASAVLLLALSKAGNELRREVYLEKEWLSLLQPLFEAGVGLFLFTRARFLFGLFERTQHPARGGDSPGTAAT